MVRFRWAQILGVVLAVALSACGGGGGGNSQPPNNQPPNNQPPDPPQEQNQSPVITAVGDRVVKEGEAISFAISATDPDGDALVVIRTGGTAGGTFDSNTKTFAWTPGPADSGVYDAVFSVTDGKGGIDTLTVAITVNDVPEPPPNPPGWEVGLVALDQGTKDPNGNTYFLSFQEKNGDWNLGNMTLTKFTPQGAKPWTATLRLDVARNQPAYVHLVQFYQGEIIVVAVHATNISSHSAVFYRIDAETGSVSHTIGATNTTVDAAVLDADGTIYLVAHNVGNDNGFLMKTNIDGVEFGTSVWAGIFNWLYLSPNGELYVYGSEWLGILRPYVRKINKATLADVWKFQRPDVNSPYFDIPYFGDTFAMSVDTRDLVCVSTRVDAGAASSVNPTKLPRDTTFCIWDDGSVEETSVLVSNGNPLQHFPLLFDGTVLYRADVATKVYAVSGPPLSISIDHTIQASGVVIDGVHYQLGIDGRLVRRDLHTGQVL